MNYLSVCSGIEATTVAWHDFGFNPVGFSEIEPFPAAVLQHHYPSVPNFGDMTKFKEWNLEPNGIDLLVGGTPCQSFSVAGLRKGLDDPRGNLALTYCTMLDHFRPTWFVWENVPGVLSSNGGRDFGSFLGAVAELGYGFSYRVLDAQFFGVAQRRRRVFVVGHIGNWQRSAAVLFERQSLRRDTAPSREAWQEVAGTFAARSGISRNNHEHAVATTLQARMGEGGFDLETETPVVTHTLRGEGFDCDGGLIQTFDRQSTGEYGTAPVASTVAARDYKSASDLVAQPINFSAQMSVPQVDIDLCQTLGAKNPQAVAFAQNTRDEVRLVGGDGGIVGALAAQPGMKQTSYVAQPMAFDLAQITSAANRTRVDPSLPASTISKESDMHVASTMAVRRLTPIECERLQGFPDNYTNIPWRKKPESPDGPRYKALGNSMAVPVMRWIGNRIKMVSEL